MSESAFVNDARVMSKGQVTIPNNVRVVNSAVYAMMRLQEQMKGEAEKAGFFTEKERNCAQKKDCGRVRCRAGYRTGPQHRSRINLITSHL